MSPSELREEQAWSGELARSYMKRLKPPLIEIEELSFKAQMELEDEARDFATRMIASQKGEAVDLPRIPNGPSLVNRYHDMGWDGASDEDISVGDLAAELAEGFKIADRLVWFLKELDIEGVELPEHVEKESILLYKDAKVFCDRMERGDN